MTSQYMLSQILRGPSMNIGREGTQMGIILVDKRRLQRASSCRLEGFAQSVPQNWLLQGILILLFLQDSSTPSSRYFSTGRWHTEHSFSCDTQDQKFDEPWDAYFCTRRVYVFVIYETFQFVTPDNLQTHLATLFCSPENYYEIQIQGHRKSWTGFETAIT